MSLDMRTVILGNVLNAVICFLVIAVLWLQSRDRFDGTGLWAWDYFLQVPALLLIALRGTLPDWASITLANTLAVIGTVLGYVGLERFVGKPTRQYHNIVLVVVFMGIHGYYSLFQPDLNVRTMNIAIALFIVFFQCLWLLWYRVDTGMRSITWGVGLVFGAFSAVSVVRVVELLVNPRSKGDFLLDKSFDPGILMVYQILLVLLTFSLVLMVSKRLMNEVRTQEEKFSKAFHSSPYAITLTRLSDGRILEVNPGFETISGYTKAEVLGKDTESLQIWEDPKDRRIVVNELVQNGKIREKENRFRKKGGESIIGLISSEIITIGQEKYVLSSINDITEKKSQEFEREKLIRELQDALGQVKKLSGFLPICASCKKIRDDQGYWRQIEAYVREHSEAEFSHGICPECARRLYPEYTAVQGVNSVESGKIERKTPPNGGEFLNTLGRDADDGCE